MILRNDPGTAGGWSVIVVGEAVLALADAPAEVDHLAARLAGADGFRVALECLVSRGIAAAPDFALVEVGGGIARVVLRGPAELEAGAELVSGAGVTTWTERVFEGVGELRLRVPGSMWTIGTAPAGGAGDAAASPVAARVIASAATASAATASRATASRVTAAAPERPIAREDAAPHATLAPPRDEPLRDDQPRHERPRDEATGRAASRDEALAAAPAAAPAPAPAPARTPDPEDAEPYAFLFGDTVYRTIGGVDLRIPNPDPARPGDHDGRTVLVDRLEQRERHERHEQRELPSVPPRPGPDLLLELPDGAVEPLTAPLLIGRSPSDPRRDAPGGAPRLVRIAAGDKDISRTHARIEVAGGSVVVTDLDSRNGTSVTMPGGAPRKLRAGEPAIVLPDTVIDLGGGVTMTVRERA
jgi:hypothetical protein